MILCEKCRTEIPNPDPKTFDLNLRAINTNFGLQHSIGPIAWRLLTLLISKPESIITKTLILEDLYGAHPEAYEDIEHALRVNVHSLRKALVDTEWTIINRCGHGYVLTRGV